FVRCGGEANSRFLPRLAELCSASDFARNDKKGGKRCVKKREASESGSIASRERLELSAFCSQKMLLFADVTASVAHFVAFEVLNLISGLLLGHAVHGAESPDEVAGIDGD